MSNGAKTTKRKYNPSAFSKLISKEIESGGISPSLGKLIVAEQADMRRRLKGTRRRLKEVEGRLEAGATPIADPLSEKLAALSELVESYDIRQVRMGVALRQCMRTLGVKRDGSAPDGG
jgi:hypothetical protein